MLSRLFYLQPGELRRLMPFFGIYLLLFTALTLADGVSASLFVHRVGAASLPHYYGLTAVVNLILIGLYILYTERLSTRLTFQLIIGGSVGAFMLAWLAINVFHGGPAWTGLFFVAREISFTLVLMHFGTFLQDYFTRGENNRILPIVYSGGRLGGMLGGVLLEQLSPRIGLMNLVLVYVAMGLVCMAIIACSSSNPPTLIEEDLPVAGQMPQADQAEGLAGFWRFMQGSPLLVWLSINSLLFMICRYVLQFQALSFFHQYFPSEVKMAEFLGLYTTIALTGSLILQTLVVNRLVAWVGLKGAHLLFSILVLSGMAINMLPMSLASAIYSRLLETELRFGLRNPIAQLMTNLFPKTFRIRARAWSIGAVTPLATMLASVILQTIPVAAVSITGLGVSLAYFASSFGLYGSFEEPPSRLKLALAPTPLEKSPVEDVS
jgi:ATP/ADP translocase